MKINAPALASNFQRHLKRVVVGLVALILVWQNTVISGDMAIASPLLAVSADSMSKQVTGKVDEVKGKAKQAIGKAQSGMEDKAESVKSKVKDDLTEAKIAVDSNNARIGNAADKAGDQVKGFFGK
jgi:uncharacterized protein YjbJ (UPF0337 family)